MIFKKKYRIKEPVQYQDRQFQPNSIQSFQSLSTMKRFISLLFLSLTIFTNVTRSDYTPCKLCIDRATPTELDAMELRLYTGPTLSDYKNVRITDASILLDNIDKSKPTVVYISGWLSHPDKPSVKTIVSAYLTRGDHNVLIFDWHKIAGRIFTYALLSVNGVGYTLAKALNELVAGGLNVANLNLVGHSFGAQISGYVGRYVNFRLSRITGLDPAGVGYYGVNDRLTSSDADFVLVIHSDVFLYGINLSLANADFYPNGGLRPQPGCSAFGFPLFGKKDFCSHYRACEYYTESVQNEGAFISQKCDSYSKFQRGLCRSNQKEVMGFATLNTTRGNFYLQTNNAPFYDRGEDGLIYKP